MSVLVLGGGLYINSQRAEIIRSVLTTAEETASKTLNVPVKIGGVEVGELNIFDAVKNSDLTVRDIDIFDKNEELIAHVNSATVDFKFLMLKDDPVAAIDEIKINGAILNATQREDKSWNFDDINIESEGESTFDAKISADDVKVNATYDGKLLAVEDINVTADCADMNAIVTTVAAKTLGSNVKATGVLGSAQQIVNAQVDEIFLDKVKGYLPEKTLPEGVEILSGTAKDTTLHILRRDDKLTYMGNTEVNSASVKVEETDIEEINGTVTFSEKEVVLNASATANGQRAAASGTIRLDTDETFFDVHAQSDSFAPAAVIPDIGIDGAAKVDAHLVGTVNNPQVEAKIYSDYLAYQDIAAQNVSTNLRYVGDMLYLSETNANILGGTISGTAEVKTADLSYNANVKANNLDAVTLCEFIGSTETVYGKISGDLGINGIGADGQNMKIYGNAKATTLDYNGLHVDEADASFYWHDNNLNIDYLSAKIPNRGTLGLEGNIIDAKNLDLKFYGAHVDMTIFKNFDNAIETSGLTDFKGTIVGDIENPAVTLKLSAVDNSEREGNHFKGNFFKQPYDSIQLAASGSLDGINIDTFDLVRDGELKWTVIEGNVGLTGERNVNVHLKTTAVRAEDIAALVAPDQEITGNVFNTVKITGTLDNPKVGGHISFSRGSYRGMLLSGMTGDYFMEGDTLRLQNFQITSPMVDMFINGKINTKTQVMDFVVAANDVNLERFKAKLPQNYIAEGHTTFEGIIQGTPDVPIFDGELKSDSIFLNGVELTDVYGHIMANGMNVYLDDFHFNDGNGVYQLQISTNLDYQTISGEVNVSGADIAHMLTIADKRTDLITGKLDSNILLSGTLDKPSGSITGEIPKGTFAEHDIHDIILSATFNNNVLFINKLEGKQGDKGTINILGSTDLNGAIDLTMTTRDIELGMFSKAAGFNTEMVGTSNIDAKIGGTMNNPTGEVNLTATGGIKGSTFDLLRGHFLLKDWRVNVEELIVQRELGGKNYGAKVNGFIPLIALTEHDKEKLKVDEQLNLTVSLDDADLSLLPVLSKQVAWAIGELGGSLKITGTLARPQVNGKISLTEGSVKVKDMKSLIEHVNISTAFVGERFDIETCGGNIGGGTFALTGGFSFPGLTITDYNFDFVADKLDIDSEVFDGEINANFNFSEGKIFHWHMPKLSGAINLDKCRFTVPSIPDSDEPLPNILLDVSLNLGEKVHFYSSRLYDMYLIGSANFKGTTLHPKTSGAINVKRGGTLTYLESVFNIREGEAHFNQIDTFMPSLHFAAETKIDRTKIFLDIDGAPDAMKFKLHSSPEMNETEILRLLTMREAYGSGENLSAADALAIGLQMTILSDIEDALKKTLGIDQLRISRGSGSMFNHRTTEERNNSGNKNDYNLTIGKYINDKLMIRYTHGFGSHKVNRYGIQYDFNDNLGFTIEREGKDYIFGFEARYKF